MAEGRALLPARHKEAIRMMNKPRTWHSFKLAGDPNLTRRAFIGESMLLALAVKIGVAFAGEGAQSDNGAQTATGSKIAKVLRSLTESAAGAARSSASSFRPTPHAGECAHVQ